MLKEKIEHIIKNIEKLHSEDDYALYKLWDELTELLSVSEQETIHFLQSCEDNTIIMNISSVFEDVARQLKSKKYIECLEKLENRNPKLKYRVEAAKNTMIDE